MRLLIANFDCQRIVTKEQVTNAIRRLPKSHYEGIQAIRYDPYRTLATTISFLQNKASCTRTQGFYYHEKDMSVIIIFPFQSLAEFYHILYHEIGHYVFLRTLDQGQRDHWMYKVRSWEKKWISEHAKQNSREDFAETYAFYCLNSPRLLAVPHKKNFFQEIVFGGSRFPHFIA